MHVIIRRAIIYLPLIDIPLFFGFLLGRVDLHQIIDPEIQQRNVSDEIDEKSYDAWIEAADIAHGKGMYPNDLIVYYHRKLKTSDKKRIRDDILPAVYAPLSMIIWWTKYMLKCGVYWVHQVQSLFDLALCTPVQLQGLLLCHYATWCRPV